MTEIQQRATGRPSLTREGYEAFIERHEVAWELSMGGLALVWVAIGFLLDESGTAGRGALEALELAITLVFVAEFASRMVAAHERARYLRGHWIDALALAPPVRGLRVLRLLRLLRLVRAFEGFYRAAMHLRRLAAHRGFAWVIVAWLTVMAVCSAFVYTAEHGVNKLMESPFDALWWGVSTITTVGYGDTYPVTREGRLGAMVLMVLGIGLFSAITAMITSFFVTLNEGSGDRSPESLVQHLERLADLRADGALTDAEFERAKELLLRTATTAPPPSSAADRDRQGA